MSKSLIYFGLIISFVSLSILSCNSDNNSDCNNLNVIENTFTGDIDITSGGQDPGADFVGNGDSGNYFFEWCNPQKRASLDFDITTSAGGSVRIVLKDHDGEIVLDKTRPNGGNDTYSGVSDNGLSGTWQVEVYLTNVNGDGSWSMHPGD